MTLTVCLAANTFYYPEGGGHLWVYLNWALGLRALGCRVIWLEGIRAESPAALVREKLATLKMRLCRYDLADCVALCSRSDEPLPQVDVGPHLNLDAAAEADLLINFSYRTPSQVVQRFKRSALIDIDPGLLQAWVSARQIALAKHHVYFTIGERIGPTPLQSIGGRLEWIHTPPCVALDWWPCQQASENAPFTTVSHWYAEEWVADGAGQFYRNDKRSGFLPFLELPRRTRQRLELALCLAKDDDDERRALRQLGWQVREAAEVAATPWDYQQYVARSRGEFSCAKPSCMRFQNAWISDRTICYLASGKPAVVQHTGPSRFLPDAAGLFRFHDLDEATQCLEAVAADYERQCRLARALAEEHFDDRKVVNRILTRALA